MLSSLSFAWSDNVLILSLMFLQILKYFSLGITVYEMGVGQHPFAKNKETLQNITKKILIRNPDYPLDVDFYIYDLLKRVSIHTELQRLYCSATVIGHSEPFIILDSSLQLLWKDQEERKDKVSDIRSNRLFKTIDWVELEGRKLRTPSESAPVSIQIMEVFSSRLFTV